MGIVLETDSDKQVHQVWRQEQANSCAIASLWMARSKARQMSFKETEWELAWRTYHQVVRGMILYPKPPPPASLDPTAFQPNQDTFGNMFASAGTYMSQVANALRMEGLHIGYLSPFKAGTSVIPAFLSERTPAIVLLGWYHGDTRNGGHFIVAARTARNGRIVYLDPWYGLSEQSASPAY